MRNAYLTHPDGTTTLLLRYGGRVYASLIDTADLPLVDPYSWHLSKGLYCNNVYVRTCLNPGTLYLHRLLMSPPLGLEVDHRNHDGLDNRRENLRTSTPHETRLNRRVPSCPRAPQPIVNVLNEGQPMRRCSTCGRLRSRFWLTTIGTPGTVCHTCPEPTIVHLSRERVNNLGTIFSETAPSVRLEN